MLLWKRFRGQDRETFERNDTWIYLDTNYSLWQSGCKMPIAQILFSLQQIFTTMMKETNILRESRKFCPVCLVQACWSCKLLSTVPAKSRGLYTVGPCSLLPWLITLDLLAVLHIKNKQTLKHHSKGLILYCLYWKELKPPDTVGTILRGKRLSE